MNYLLLIPATLLLLLVFGFPLIRYFWLSLHASSVLTGLEPIYNNGANWIRLISDGRFWQDLYQTSRFAVFSVGIEMILALVIALLLNNEWKSKQIYRSITLLPWALPTTIMALSWRWIFNTPYGPIDQILNLIGFNNLNILSNPSLAWVGTVIADVWKTTPFIALILLAGLQTIPVDLYEAFRLEGGSPKQSFLYITLPLLKPYLLLGLIFRLAQAFGVFDLIQVMTGGGPASSTESLAIYSYLNAMRFLDFGYSSTIMLASFMILIFVCLSAYIVTITITNNFRRYKL